MKWFRKTIIGVAVNDDVLIYSKASQFPAVLKSISDLKDIKSIEEKARSKLNDAFVSLKLYIADEEEAIFGNEYEKKYYLVNLRDWSVRPISQALYRRFYPLRKSRVEINETSGISRYLAYCRVWIPREIKEIGYYDTSPREAALHLYKTLDMLEQELNKLNLDDYYPDPDIDFVSTNGKTVLTDILTDKLLLSFKDNPLRLRIEENYCRVEALVFELDSYKIESIRIAGIKPSNRCRANELKQIKITIEQLSQMIVS